MIAMLEIVPDNRNPLLKKISRITPRKITAQLMLAGEIQLVSVKHREHFRGINWRALEDITEAADWLLPSGLSKPDKSSLRVFSPMKLPAVLMENLAVNVLYKADIKPSSLCIGIYPQKESMLTEHIIDRAREVRILCTEYNEEFAQDIMERYGAAIVCSDRNDIFEKCQMVIAPNDIKGYASTSKNALLFSPSENQHQALHVRSTVPQSPDIYAYPTRLFGALRTLSAFYELENRSELGLITPLLANLENGLITSNELSRYLKVLTA